MKKIWCIALVLICILTCFSINVSATQDESEEVWNGGRDITWYDETQNEYALQTAEELAGFAQLVANGVTFEGKTVKLNNNILLNNYDYWTDWTENYSVLNEWAPIGSADKPFKGTFDGQGCSVVGLFVSSKDNDVGFFGVTQNATIKNINVIYSFVSGGSNVGALCGRAIETDFLHCHTEANVVGNGTVGGSIGCVNRSKNSGVRYVKECSSKGSVVNNVTFSSDEYYLSTKATGGVIGAYVSREIGDTATIENCANYSYVQGTSCVGGVVGRFHTYYTQNIVVRNCINDGNVKSNDKRAGGIIGYNYQDGSLGNSNSVTIEQCINYGTVTGDGSSLGGILGFSHICSRNTSCVVKNSVNLNSVNVIRGARDTRYSDKVQVNNSESIVSGIALDELKTRFSFGNKWVSREDGKIYLNGSYWDGVKFDNITYIQKASCQKNGQISYSCSLCNEHLGDGIVPQLEHTNSGWVTDREPTCKTEGVRHFVCSTCNETFEETIAVLEHAYGEWTVVKGNKLIPPIVKEKTCNMCGNTQTERDWSYIWITILAGLALVGVAVGVINYFRGIKKTRG